MNDVTTYYLEMYSASALQEKSDSKGLQLSECEPKQFQLNKGMYQLVGKDWQWLGKLSWTDEQWQEYAENDNLRTWVAHYENSIAGYYELHKENNDVEIAIFGLAPGFVDKGFGGYLLSHTIKSAWAWSGTERVWVHTCTLDHSNALRNYKARGMELYKTEP